MRGIDCAHSRSVKTLPRLEKTKNRRLSHKNPKIFDFLFNTSTPFPESGSRKRFHVSGMRGIDFSHKITSRNVFFTKIFFGEQNPIVTPSLKNSIARNLKPNLFLSTW